MIGLAENSAAAVCALAMFPLAGDTTGSLIRLLVFIAIFVGPAILKAIKESRRKQRESAQQGTASPTRVADEETSDLDPTQAEPESVSTGREQWERLMRGESQASPPPIPRATPVVQAPSRRVLTETRALTEEPAMTEAPALTDERPEISATPGRPIGDPTGYDGANIPKSGLAREFADFTPQEGLASDKAQGPRKRIGAAPTFAGSEAFESLSTSSAPSAVDAGEIGAGGADLSGARRSARGRMTRAQLRRWLRMAEVLGPPVGMRAFDSGPTRPLGWS